jgi:hypothetical protein
MWGTSSRDDKLRSDFGNVTEATQIGGCWVESAQAGKLSQGNFGLLQHYLPKDGVIGLRSCG